MSASARAAPMSSSVDGPGLQLRGERLCALERPVEDDRDGRAARAEVPRGELAHSAGADEHDAPAVEALEDLLRERGRGGGDRCGALADGRLDARAASRVEGHAEDAVEERPGRARLEGVAHLPEDLALARHHRVEAGGHAEEMERRRLVGEAVRDRSERLGRRPREREQRAVGEVGQSVLVLRREVELGAVAGRENDRLVRRVGRRQAVRECPGGREVDGDALAQLEGGAVVRHTCEREPHAAKWVRGSTTATSTAPATSVQASRRPCRPASRRSSSARP